MEQLLCPCPRVGVSTDTTAQPEQGHTKPLEQQRCHQSWSQQWGTAPALQPDLAMDALLFSTPKHGQSHTSHPAHPWVVISEPGFLKPGLELIPVQNQELD